MPAQPSSSPKQFIQGAPVLHVPDVEATARYYRDVLGFTWDFGDATYSVVWRDNSAIHFTKDERPPVGVHLFQWYATSMRTMTKSPSAAHRLPLLPSISPMEFASWRSETSTESTLFSDRTLRPNKPFNPIARKIRSECASVLRTTAPPFELALALL
jgi:hypothetical protein